jgi:hypothetical protein
MKKIIGYLKEYLRSVDKRVLLFSTIFTAFLVFCNYQFGLNKAIYQLAIYWQYIAWYLVFFVAFAFGYWLHYLFTKSTVFTNKRFLLLLLIAPALFSWKMASRIEFAFSKNAFVNEYWNAVVYWPIKVLVITAMLLLIHRLFDKDQPFYGLSRDFSVKPYLIMLLIMVPLVAAASMQEDFLRMYPRMQKIEYLLLPERGWYKLLYQLSYGSDFFTIELFFRGFLILAFARFVSKDAILPMAVFYCAIHFGKPLGECISSYFGGIILGVVSYHTRTILGGFIVHVGIAWLMELGGYLGHV